jgi:hypothetical protein
MICTFTLFFCVLFSAAYGYDQNPYVSSEVWQMLTPFFLPEDHPLKPQLDELFSKRITKSSKTLKKAGFKNTKPQEYSKTIVTKHKKIKEYYFKLFTDDQPNINDWEFLYARVLGAQRVKDSLDRNQLHHLCKVPQKWIYPLPQESSSQKNEHGKNFILIAEDMKIYSRNRNFMLWKRTDHVTAELLDAIYLIIKEQGLNDCIFPHNIPFSKVDHKVAFIDLERSHTWPILFGKLVKYLPVEHQPYWIALYNSQ